MKKFILGTLSFFLSLTTMAQMQQMPQASPFVSSLPPVQLGFNTTTKYVLSSRCSSAASVKSLDSNGANSPVAANTIITLTENSSTIQTYSDSKCITIASTVQIPAGGYISSNFYFKDAVVENISLTAAANLSNGNASISQPDFITNVATKILFSTISQYTQAGHCSSVVQVQGYDSNGAISPVAGGTKVTYTSNSSTLQFYTNANCSVLGNVVNMAANSWRSPNMYFKDTSVENPTILATATVTGVGGINSTAQQPESVTNAPTALSFYTAVQTVASGACSKPVVIDTLDGGGNIAPVSGLTTVSITGTGSAKFYSNNTCTTGISSVKIAAGSYLSSLFYFKDSVIETLPLKVTAIGLAPSQQNEVSSSPTPHSVTLTWNASTGTNVAGYNIYRSMTSGGGYSLIGTVGAATLTYPDANVTPNATYYYVATAFDTSSPPKESVYSNEAKAVIPYP